MALESAVLKVAAAREYASKQRKTQQDRVSSLSVVLPTVDYYREPCSPAALEGLEPSLSRGTHLH